MRYKDLTESPIDQYKPIGNWDNKDGSMRISKSNIETSHKIINSALAVKKIRHVWAKTPYKFNFFLINLDNSRYRLIHTTWGSWSIEEFKNKPDILQYADQLTFSNDAINVVFTTNFTNPSNYMPLTAWIMAHRLEHIFLNKNYPHYDDAHEKLATILEKTSNTYDHNYNIKNYKSVREFDIINNLLNEFVHVVFTMRSARTKRLFNIIDYNAELMAQWLLTGSIKFNLVPDEIEIMNKIYKITPSQQNMLNASWQQLAKDLAVDYDLLFKSQIGRVLCL